MKTPGKPGKTSEPGADWAEVIRNQVSALESGLIEIIVHDSKVVQIETTERLSLEDKKSQKQISPPGQ